MYFLFIFYNNKIYHQSKQITAKYANIYYGADQLHLLTDGLPIGQLRLLLHIMYSYRQRRRRKSRRWTEVNSWRSWSSLNNFPLANVNNRSCRVNSWSSFNNFPLPYVNNRSFRRVNSWSSFSNFPLPYVNNRSCRRMNSSCCCHNFSLNNYFLKIEIYNWAICTIAMYIYAMCIMYLF